MSNAGELIKVCAVRFERVLPAPAERAWAHLSVPEKLSGWYGSDSRIEPREGGAVDLMSGHIKGVVTQWKAPRKLVHTWNVFSPGETESQYPESYLTLELLPRGAETVLTLLHLPVLDRFEKQNAMGWHTFLDMLGDALAGRPVQPRRAYMERNAGLYGIDLGNLQR